MSIAQRIRAWVVVSILPLAVGTLAGCNSPPPESRVAIRYLGNGQAEVLALVCQGQQVTSLAVYESDAEGHGKGWVVGPSLTGEPRYAERTELLRVQVFHAPDGWQTDDSSLNQLAPGVPYAVSFSTVEGQPSTIRFTLNGLEGLDDRVLTGPWMDEQAMKEPEFVKAARKDCDKRQKSVPTDESGPSVVNDDGNGVSGFTPAPWETPPAT